MANFTPNRVSYIENTNTIAIGKQTEEFGRRMTLGKKDQDKMRELMKVHNQELHDSAARVTAKVDNANASAETIQASIK